MEIILLKDCRKRKELLICLPTAAYAFPCRGVFHTTGGDAHPDGVVNWKHLRQGDFSLAEDRQIKIQAQWK